MEDPDLWNNPEKAQNLGKERVDLRAIVHAFGTLEQALKDTKELIDLIAIENDATAFVDLIKDIDGLEKQIGSLEFTRMFSGKMDGNNAFVDIQAGSGGTEAQIGQRCC